LPQHFADLGLTEHDFFRYRALLFDGATAFSICGRFDETVRGWGFSAQETRAFCNTMDYLYRCAVRRLDILFDAVLSRIEAAGLLDSSLLAFTADHGETLYRDNTLYKFAHGYQLAPEVLRVPMIIRAPSLGVKPRRHHFVSRSIDVFPTLAGLAGIDLSGPRALEGVDLTPALTGAAQAPSLAAFSHTALVHANIVNDPEYHDSTLHRIFPERDPELMWVSVRQRNTVVKLTRPDPAEGFVATAFDLARDPEERHDLFDPADEHHQRALASLKRYKARLVDAWRHGPVTTGLEEEERIRRLKALGYL
jgi:arylsulfatase A-like enzyme